MNLGELLFLFCVVAWISTHVFSLVFSVARLTVAKVKATLRKSRARDLQLQQQMSHARRLQYQRAMRTPSNIIDVEYRDVQ